MIKRRSELQEFARSYTTVRMGMFGIVPRSVRAKFRALRTLVVDASQISDGTQHLVRTWQNNASDHSPEITAYYATRHSTAPLMRGLHTSLHSYATIDTPAYRHGSDEVEWTAWHQGAEYLLAAVGGIRETLQLCDATDTEREQAMLKARALAHEGHIVYATAHHISHQPQPHHGTMTFDGLVVCALSTFPGTHHALASLRHDDVRVVYMTSDPEDIATQVARAAGIVEHPKIARHGNFVHDTDHALYAHITRVNAPRILKQLPSPYMIARDPIARFVHMRNIIIG
jgi:phosphoglycolate phosphatase-like HAD superfamily hydrolase